MSKYSKKSDSASINASAYINVTKLCNDAMGTTESKKSFKNWKKSADAQNLMAMCSNEIGIPIDQLLRNVITGPKYLRGTYAHPVLVPHRFLGVS